MKNVSLVFIPLMVAAFSCNPQTKESPEVADKPADVKVEKYLFLDVHNLEPGKVTFDAVAGAHQKDLATQGKYDVNFIKYWVDEKEGKVYCLAESKDSSSIYQAHEEAHGLVPDLVQRVTDGPEVPLSSNPTLYLDVHHLGAGKVTAKDVADAHEKDLAVQNKHGVKFINYWVDEKSGDVMCLVEASNPDLLVNAHKEAHGLIPDEIHSVKQGQ